MTRPYRVASHSADDTAPVSDVEHSPSGPVRISPKPSTPPLVLLDRSSAGGSLQRPVPVVDGTISLCVPTHPSSREDSDQDQKGSSGGGRRHYPHWLRRSCYHLLLQMTCEIPLLLRRRWDLLLQCLTDKGMLYHTDLETFQLTVWMLNGLPSRPKAFPRQLAEQSSLPPVTPLERCTTADGRASLVGVVKG